MELGSKRKIAGTDISITTYNHATEMICKAAENRQSMAVAAISIHGVMLGTYNRKFGTKINELDLATPDGQGIRWALNLLYRLNLTDRVYGPKLMLSVVQEAAKRNLGIYLYGSTENIIENLSRALLNKAPDLRIVGTNSPPFRPLTNEETANDLLKIKNSGAQIVFVGLGCPKQETWVHDNRNCLPAVLIAVGAAFDFISGHKRQAPEWVQKCGLEMVFRVITEPRRLWRRFILCQPTFVFLVLYQLITRIFSFLFHHNYTSRKAIND
jgi:exopolysaccharide biosynthesis WecB/TagA/CpsF family protein